MIWEKQGEAMVKRAFLYVNYKNIVVLKDYLDIVRLALENNGYDTRYIESLDGIDKSSIIVFPMAVDAFRYYWKGYKRIILWQQGAIAEESFLRNHSKLRLMILNGIDCFIMKKAILVLYVSKELRSYYETRARQSYESKSYIMPCFNEELDVSVLQKKDYKKPSFVYVGSLDLWQCFRQTVALYTEIERRIPGCSFKVLTFQTEEAEQIIREAGAKNCCVKFVPKENVRQELTECSYGFVLREDIEVNRVSTPTKISSYLAAGVIPVVTSSVKDFAAFAKDKSCACIVKDTTDIETIISFMNSGIRKNDVAKDIIRIFGSYYNKEIHINNISELLRICLK